MFTKPALSIEAQVDLLEKRGMQIADRARAIHYLTHINYYRLRAYWLPFEAAPAADGDHRFRPGTAFDDILAIYVFDRELRILLIDAIERFEISLRTAWAHHLAVTYGAFAHDQRELFTDDLQWGICQKELLKEYQRSHETFAEHYRTRYAELTTPPIWVACELMTLGHLSRWFKNLKHPADRQAIANRYGIDERVLSSFAHHLTTVRNHCAHHGRVWNRRYTVRMTPPSKKPAHITSSFNPAKPQHLYNTLTMLAYLLDVMSPGHTLRQRLLELIEQYPQANPIHMGFLPDWQARPVWRAAK